MQTSQLISLLLCLSAWTISCFPSKPLNERSTELTWQAWLLIDESQNKQQDNTLRRRITPKSVFIAPTFSPENLPECSEGYQSDSMGRCIKIIMLNKELHLDFLLQQLNQKFGGMEDYEDEEGTTTGPLNINIPLNSEFHEDTDIAIVVAPTNGILQSESEMQKQLNKTLSEEKMNVGDIAGILGLKQAAEVETTTITATSTLNSDSTTQTSPIRNYETTTTFLGGSTSEFDAHFFLDPKRQIEVKTEHYNDITTLLSTTLDDETTETENLRTTTEVKRETADPDLSLLQMDQALPYSDTSIRFSDTKREAIKPNDLVQTPTEASSTEFTAETVSIMPETTSVYSHHQQSHNDNESSQATMVPIVLTPIDNSLSNQFIPHKTVSPVVSTTASQVFSMDFHKPMYNKWNTDNTKFLTRFKIDLEQFTQESPEPTISTTEEMTSTIISEETSTSSTEASTYFTEIPKNTIPAKMSITTNEQNRFKIPFQTSQLVRFPTDRLAPSEQAPTFVDHTLDASKQFENIFNQYIHTRGADLTENQRHIFKNNQESTPTHVDISHTLYQRYKAHRDNHRNRDKHHEWFHLPPKWSDTSQKPVVLRFSRKHGYIDSQQLGSNNFYREINPRLFGFPAKSRVLR